MNNKMLYIVLITFLVTILLTIIIKLLKNHRLNKMLNFLNCGNFDSFDDYINLKSNCLLFTPFNLDYIKLNSYIIRKNEKLIESSFLKFEKVKLTQFQKDDVYMKAFEYYLNVNNSNKIEYYFKLINDACSEQIKVAVARLYDVYYKKGSKFLNDLLSEIDNLKGKYRASNELLVSEIYKNLNNLEKHKYYLSLAMEHMES